ncbi:helix-turn-helix transcriptional regulator [Thalassospira sp.]|uniref:helix-turn-helix transcriptional regulator n=1 Tax=Thalassospira sp. TaxID=1912094 RepID=UPI00257F8379|nr:helix-turn-helix transcriptional regulator [Thalassospira sp.]|tara:strand:- start:4943 stop:5779 length:837 start_codon:yes stop_codon:yes gene_type:complete
MKIKEFRTRIQMTQSALAEQLGTTQQTIARWETGKTELSVSQLKALAVALHCSVEELVGSAIPASKQAQSPFALFKPDFPFGSLKLNTGTQTFAFPIDEQARDQLLEALRETTHQPVKPGSQRWLSARTLNNRILFINPAHCSEISLIDDNAEEMPHFTHPEVYAALEEWHQDDNRKNFEQEREDLQKAHEGMDLELWVKSIEVHFSNGETSVYLLEEETVGELIELDAYLDAIVQNQFLRVFRDSGYEHQFVNLEKVAIISAPANLFLRYAGKLMEE